MVCSSTALLAAVSDQVSNQLAIMIIRLTGGKGLNGAAGVINAHYFASIPLPPSLHPLRHDPRAASTYECECEEGLRRPAHTPTEAGGKLDGGVACLAWLQLD